MATHVRIQPHTTNPHVYERAEVRDRIESERRSVDRDQKKLMHLVFMHTLFFVLAFTFTAGASLLGLLLWVTPDNLFAIVLTTLFASVVFVASFAYVRLLAIRIGSLKLRPLEEDEEAHSHIVTSVVYAFLALVLAVLVVGLIAHKVGATTAVV